jgi:pimeloyl-ACP methyl ester carboxylesterase
MCATLGIESAAFVGSSMGGFICAELSIEQPELVSKLVLVDAAGLSHLRPYTRAERTFARAAIAAGPYISRLQRPGILRRRLRRIAFGRAYAHPELLRPELLWEQTMPALRSPGYRRAVEELIGYDYRDRLASIRAPTLIVWGSEDRVVPVDSAHEYAERIPGARLEVFDDTGHLPQLERPERFNALVEDFLAT